MPAPIKSFPHANACHDDLTDLLAQIVERHHAFTRQELARLVPLSERVVAELGLDALELRRVQPLVAELAANVLGHLEEEERDIFPCFAALEMGLAETSREVLVRLARAMREDHGRAMEIFQALRDATHGYDPTLAPSVEWRVLYDGLAALAADFRVHIRLESEIVVPMVEQLEQALHHPRRSLAPEG